METLLDPPQFQFDEFEEVATQPFQGKVAPLADAPRKLDQLEIWESESTQPTHIGGEGGSSISLTSALNNYLPRCLAHPYLPRAVIEQQKLARMQYLVALAYEEIPVYRDKYKSAGFSPSDLRTIDDIQHIPVITKQELVAAISRLLPEPALPSGRTVPHALFRQLRSDAAHSSRPRRHRHRHDPGRAPIHAAKRRRLWSESLLTHVYTVPWWFALDRRAPIRRRVHLRRHARRSKSPRILRKCGRRFSPAIHRTSKRSSTTRTSSTRNCVSPSRIRSIRQSMRAPNGRKIGRSGSRRI